MWESLILIFSNIASIKTFSEFCMSRVRILPSFVYHFPYTSIAIFKGLSSEISGNGVYSFILFLNNFASGFS